MKARAARVASPVGYEYSITSLWATLANTASAEPAVHDRIAAVFSLLLYMVPRPLLAVLSFGGRAAEQVRLENLVLRHQVAILRRQVKHPTCHQFSRRRCPSSARMSVTSWTVSTTPR